MTSMAAVSEFIGQPALAVVGVSRSGNKFGNVALRELRAKGYRLFPIHPEVARLEGERCYPDLASLPETVGGVLVVVPPAQAEGVVRQAARAGIRRVWLQQGAESPEVLEQCRQLGLEAIHGECILMFARPTAFHHRAHRWLWRVLGRLPQ